MTISMVQQNILSEMQQVATQQLTLKSRLESLVAMWTAESMNVLTDEDIQELVEFTHVSAQELQAAKNAMDAISTTIGAYVAGTPATRLLRIVLTIPH